MHIEYSTTPNKMKIFTKANKPIRSFQDYLGIKILLAAIK
jgi:hypothetical protein